MHACIHVCWLLGYLVAIPIPKPKEEHRMTGETVKEPPTL